MRNYVPALSMSPAYLVTPRLDSLHSQRPDAIEGSHHHRRHRPHQTVLREAPGPRCSASPRGWSGGAKRRNVSGDRAVGCIQPPVTPENSIGFRHDRGMGPSRQRIDQSYRLHCLDALCPSKERVSFKYPLLPLWAGESCPHPRDHRHRLPRVPPAVRSNPPTHDSIYLVTIACTCDRPPPTGTHRIDARDGGCGCPLGLRL